MVCNVVRAENLHFNDMMVVICGRIPVSPLSKPHLGTRRDPSLAFGALFDLKMASTTNKVKGKVGIGGEKTMKKKMHNHRAEQVENTEEEEAEVIRIPSDVWQ